MAMKYWPVLAYVLALLAACAPELKSLTSDQIAIGTKAPKGTVALTAAAPARVVVTPSRPSRTFSFPAGRDANPDAIAVIIGNRAYLHRDVPEVLYATNDAEAMRSYVTTTLGYSPRNVLVLNDANQSELLANFGSPDNEKGRLYDMVRAGRSDVFVFYSGHGVPGENGSGYLLPVDADPGKPQLTGYAVATLVRNLSRSRARSVVLAIDACFSGISDAGPLIKDASPVYLSAKLPAGIANGVMLTAAEGNQIASWDRDAKMGLFTRYLLEGLLGKADDRAHGGNGDAQVSAAEIKRYLASEVTYEARRRYGRDQTPQMAGDPGRGLASVPAGKFKGF